MTPKLLTYLCDPTDKSDLVLINPVYDGRGRILSGELRGVSGRHYPIRDGIPRFVEDNALAATVESFGREWNHFNFDQFRLNWLNHTVKNTFGSSEAFRGKIIVDAGGGSGMQSRWMAEAGADHVICLELSHAVDGITRQNLECLDNVDIVQCSIDAPPIRDAAISGIVICHNVIQHTPSVEDTARALWRIVAPGGEFVFNCYGKNESSGIWMLRFRLYTALRKFLSRRSFHFLLAYSRAMSLLRFVPLLGWLLEKGLFMVRGEVPAGPRYISRCYLTGVLNTFDWYGSHQYQHHKTEGELRALVTELQPNPKKVLNLDQYFLRPPSIGCAIRIFK
jgi:2-polyprenyl-3-methyl-5-hydroxy-6-metoxy-1,4-benzoquinol methylase/uncharacterized protein YbaR (Trm112 family)